MRRGVLLFAFCVLATVFAPPREAAADAMCSLATEAMKRVEKIRGLAEKRQTPCIVQGKEEVKKFILHTIETKMPADRLDHEGLVYKTIGLIPEDFDYAKGMVEYYLSQIGGYYNPDEKRFVMAGWLPAVLQATVAAHELTHALQDQHFDLNKALDHEKFSSDELLARSALIEGDATAVMLDYTRGALGQGPISDDPNVEGVLMQNVLGASMMGGGVTVPASMTYLLLFPYNSGLRFAHALLKDGGYPAIDKAFQRLPRSTEEILHPEKYLDANHGAPIHIANADLAQGEFGPVQSVRFGDTLGEFVTSLVLSQLVGPSQATAIAAAGWGGDRIILSVGEDSRPRIRWQTRWDSPQDASQYLDVLLQGFTKRYSLSSIPKGEWIRVSGMAEELRIQAEGAVVDVMWRVRPNALSSQ